MSSQPVLKATLGKTVKNSVLLLFTDSTVSPNVIVQRRTVITLTAVNKPVRHVLLQINHAWYILYAWNLFIFMLWTKYITRNPNVIILGIINATLVYKILQHHLKIYKDDAKTLSIKLYNAEMYLFDYKKASVLNITFKMKQYTVYGLSNKLKVLQLICLTLFSYTKVSI